MKRISFGDVLRSERGDKSLARMAEILGMDRSHYLKLENGTVGPPPVVPRILEWAEALGLQGKECRDFVEAALRKQLEKEGRHAATKAMDLLNRFAVALYQLQTTEESVREDLEQGRFGGEFKDLRCLVGHSLTFAVEKNACAISVFTPDGEKWIFFREEAASDNAGTKSPN